MRRRTVGGRYQIGAEIGSGGMGTVYRARDKRTGLVVAVKLLHAHLAQDEAYLERFRREAHIATSLESPHVVKVLDYGEDQGVPFIAMEFVAGKSLRAILRERGRLSANETLAIALQVADALAEAHRKGVVHRDIKPQNIMLTPDGAVKVADFGIARGEDYSTITQTGAFFGTVQYAAPEHFQGKADVRSDIYSLGVVLYQMLSGSPPFAADTLLEVMRLHVEEPPPPLMSRAPEIHKEIDAIVGRCLAKSPADRFQSPDELSTAIRSALPPEELGKASAVPPPRGRFPWPVAVAGGMAGLANVPPKLAAAFGDWWRGCGYLLRSALVAGGSFIVLGAIAGGIVWAQMNGGGTTAPPPCDLQAPSNVRAQVVATSVLLTWQDNSDNEDGFRIQVSGRGDDYGAAGEVRANVTNYLTGPLTPAKTYRYRVRAYNARCESDAGDAASVAIPIVPTRTATPSLTATATRTPTPSASPSSTVATTVPPTPYETELPPTPPRTPTEPTLTATTEPTPLAPAPTPAPTIAPTPTRTPTPKPTPTRTPTPKPTPVPPTPIPPTPEPPTPTPPTPPTPTPTVPLGVNLVRNPSFEDGSSYWGFLTDTPGYEMVIQGTWYRIGIRALELPPMPDSPPPIAREAKSGMFGVDPSKTYTFSFYAYAQESATIMWFVDFYASDGARCEGPGGKVAAFGQFDIVSSVPAWQEYVVELGPGLAHEIAACAALVDVDLQQGNFISPNPTTSIFIDDVRFVRSS